MTSLSVVLMPERMSETSILSWNQSSQDLPNRGLCSSDRAGPTLRWNSSISRKGSMFRLKNSSLNSSSNFPNGTEVFGESSRVISSIQRSCCVTISWNRGRGGAF